MKHKEAAAVGRRGLLLRLRRHPKGTPDALRRRGD